MDKPYIQFTISNRLTVLKDRYRHLVILNKDETGLELSKGSSAVIRSKTLNDINTLKLIEELVYQIKSNEIELSDDADKALDRLLEPNEKNRRKRMALKELCGDEVNV